MWTSYLKIFEDNWAVGEPLANESLKWYKEILFHVPAVVVEENPEEEMCDLHHI